MKTETVYVAVARVLKRGTGEIEVERKPAEAIVIGGLGVRRISAREWQLLHVNSGACLSYWPTRRAALQEVAHLIHVGGHRWKQRREVSSVKRDPVLRKLLRTATRVA